MVRGTPGGLPPVILVGGDLASGVSIARSLSKHGVGVYVLCKPRATVTFSRFARRLPADREDDGWVKFLLGPQAERLHGAVLLACSDDGVQILLDHREALAERYVLDICNPAAHWCFLSKLATYEAAREAGVPTPLFWRVDGLDDIHAHRDEYVYPLIIKPLFSHRFKKVFSGARYFVVHDFDELVKGFEKVRELDVEVLLLEEIPGDDDRLCSCYTYIDEDRVPLFDFTKRIIRRFPEHQGFGCYHITDWNPEVLELGLRLVRHVGLLGLCNVEFKRDDRDGQLKVIECNVRFTAPIEILVASGYDLPLFVYNRLIGRPQADMREKEYRRNVRLWYPVADFLAFLELHGQGRLSFRAWVASILHPQVLPYFRWDDPLPSLVVNRRVLTRVAKRGIRRALRRPRA